MIGTNDGSQLPRPPPLKIILDSPMTIAELLAREIIQQIRKITSTSGAIAVLALSISASSVAVARQSPAKPANSIGQIQGNGGIVSQGDNAQNTVNNISSMLLFHGEAVISPPAKSSCKDGDPSLIVIGQNLIWYTAPHFSVLKSNGSPILSFERQGTSLLIKTLAFFDAHGQALAYIQDGKISYFSGARVPDTNPSSFILYGADTKEILNISYTNECVVRINTSFHIGSRWVRFQQDSPGTPSEPGITMYGNTMINKSIDVRENSTLIDGP